MKKDYYEILGVPRSADAAAIKAAYRKLARRYHPDVNKDADASQRFAEVQEAYDVLSDEERRRAYDQFGHAGAHAGAGPGPGAGPGGMHYTWSNVGGAGGFQGEDFDVGSIFEDLFGARGPRSTGHSGFGRAARGRAAAARGADITEDITVDFLEAVKGGRKTLRIRRGGSTQTIDVTIPRAVKDGARLRIKGSGAPSTGSGPPGDLILRIHVRPHPWFTRDDLDISIDVPITIAEAALGTSIDLPTLSGAATLKVPAGVDSGRRLRLKGQGVQEPDGRTGDLLAHIRIVAPHELTEAQQNALRELGRDLPNPRRGSPWT
ncbi:MAG: DnaJ domain-containing protein [Phycisphaerales bacterium]|nr:DnaJ domain-containing protein [Phycisphaerales bacterium]